MRERRAGSVATAGTAATGTSNQFDSGDGAEQADGRRQGGTGSADIQAWAASYTAAYVNPPYVGGQVQGSTAQISAQATKTTGMQQTAILQSTQIILTVNVTTKATEPVGGTQDSVSQFPVQVIFTNPGQIKLTSV